MASEASMTAPATTVNSRFTSWPIRFLELKAFREEHGHTLVPYKYPKNKPLGRWVRIFCLWFVKFFVCSLFCWHVIGHRPKVHVQ